MNKKFLAIIFLFTLMIFSPLFGFMAALFTNFEIGTLFGATIFFIPLFGAIIIGEEWD